MSFQISAITIYSHNGQIRTVPFQLGKLNIVTGDSRRGKSALLNIVDYCLASKTYVIKGATLRRYVRVFAVTLVKDHQQVFVARPAPVPGNQSASTMSIVAQAPGTPPPALADLHFTTPLEAAHGILSNFAGIDQTVKVNVGRNVNPIPPTIRHTLFFCLQKQNEIANQDLLFHSQGEEFKPATIRSVIPYFLGALDPQQALRENQLQLLRQRHAAMERSLAAARGLAAASGRALALATEAVEAGLIAPASANDSTPQTVLDRLQQALTVRTALPPTNEPDDPMSMLVNERRDLRSQHAQARARIADLRQQAKENLEFVDQAADQHARLASLDLLTQPVSGGFSHCPVCTSPTPQATGIVEMIRQDLAHLDTDIAVVGDNTPEINRLIGVQEQALQELRDVLRRNQEQIDTLTAGRRAAFDQPDALREAAVVQGRISLFLETTARIETQPVQDGRAEIQAQIAVLEDDIGESARSDRLSSFVSLISQSIKDKARALRLEHSESPIRLDTRALSVVADTRDGPVYLSDMGGGENWLGYHVTTMLSLQEWFAEQECPVPRLLMLDQPSQVYFPEDAPAGATLAGPDRIALLNLYKVIQQSVDGLHGGLQVIVMEHADLADEPFAGAVRQRWRRSNGDALVPEEWITEPVDEDEP